MFSKIRTHLTLVLLLLAMLTTGCSMGSSANATEAPTGSEVKLTLAAYTTPREAYGEIIPLFVESWKEQTGQTVVFEESYQGSGAQSRAVVEGLEADVTRIEKAGLITHDWRSEPFGGMVSTSVVAFAVNQGNPKNIHDWKDLLQPDLEILTPNPKTSGGAMWNILALYGAAKRGKVEGFTGDDAGAQDFLLSVL